MLNGRPSYEEWFQEWAEQATEALGKLRANFEAVYPEGGLFFETDETSLLTPVFDHLGFDAHYSSSPHSDPFRHEFDIELGLVCVDRGLDPMEDAHLEEFRGLGLAALPAAAPVRLVKALIATPFLGRVSLFVDPSLLDITAAALELAGVPATRVELWPGARASEWVVWGNVRDLVLDLPAPHLTEAELAQFALLAAEVGDPAAAYNAVVGP